MPDIFAITRSLVLRSSSSSNSSIEDEGGEESLLEKIGSYFRKSRLGIVSKRQKLPNFDMGHGHAIRWRKGELIGCGAYGRVYMGMDLDTGELLAVKQVSVATKHAPKDKAQENILELEEEIKLLKNLSHPNIVKYLGTERDEESLNILLEFVPGGSISSLLGKFGSFPEPVIRTYTQQLLKGLEYLHGNGIIHRDIKGANILVDNKGCIKLSDFGASKKAVELATASGTELIKGTPYWMAPEVILQTGQSFSADIWSVGCTVIEMATGKPPWSEQYQEVAALFHIGTTKSHPPIPEHLSLEAKEFLLKCLHKEPDLRPAASDLLQHPFVSGKNHAPTSLSDSGPGLKNFPNSEGEPRATCKGLMDDYNISNTKQSTTSEQFTKYGPTSEASNSEDNCQIGNDDNFKVNQKQGYEKDLMPDPFKSKFEFPETEGLNFKDCGGSANGSAGTFGMHAERSDVIPFPGEPTTSEDDDDSGGGVDEVRESKIQGFLDDRARDLKKLQTLFYEEFDKMLNSAADTSTVKAEHGEDHINDSKMPVRRSAPSIFASGVSTPHRHCKTISTTSSRMHIPHSSSSSANNILRETPESLLNQRLSCSEREKKWKEELDQELERHREMMRQAGLSRKTSFCADRGLKRPRDLS